MVLIWLGGFFGLGGRADAKVLAGSADVELSPKWSSFTVSEISMLGYLWPEVSLGNSFRIPFPIVLHPAVHTSLLCLRILCSCLKPQDEVSPLRPTSGAGRRWRMP